jgi:hypothetical protein
MEKDLLPLLMIYLPEEDIKRMMECSTTLGKSVSDVLTDDLIYWQRRFELQYPQYITPDINTINCQLLYEIFDNLAKLKYTQQRERSQSNIIGVIGTIMDYYSDVDIINLLSYCHRHEDLYPLGLLNGDIIMLSKRLQIFKLVVDIMLIKYWKSRGGINSIAALSGRRRNAALLYLFDSINNAPADEYRQDILDKIYMQISIDRNIELIKTFYQIQPITKAMIPLIILEVVKLDYPDVMELIKNYPTDKTVSYTYILILKEAIKYDAIKCLTLLLSIYPAMKIKTTPVNLIIQAITDLSTAALELLLITFPASQYPYRNIDITDILDYRSENTHLILLLLGDPRVAPNNEADIIKLATHIGGTNNEKIIKTYLRKNVPKKFNIRNTTAAHVIGGIMNSSLAVQLYRYYEKKYKFSKEDRENILILTKYSKELALLLIDEGTSPALIFDHFYDKITSLVQLALSRITQKQFDEIVPPPLANHRIGMMLMTDLAPIQAIAESGKLSPLTYNKISGVMTNLDALKTLLQGKFTVTPKDAEEIIYRAMIMSYRSYRDWLDIIVRDTRFSNKDVYNAALKRAHSEGHMLTFKYKSLGYAF